MKRSLVCLFIVAGLTALIAGCASGPKLRPDTVAIVDIQSEDLADSEYTFFKVRVAYILRSTPKAVLSLGFDLEERGRYIIVGQQEVEQGTGEVELRADVRLPKRSTVTVYADLSETDHPPEWTSLAIASRELTIMK